MNRRGHAGRTDQNHKEIVAALRQAGVLVASLASVGSGCPDLLCCYQGSVTLLEVKRPRGKLTKYQSQWRDNGWPVHVVTDAYQAMCAATDLPRR